MAGGGFDSSAFGVSAAGDTAVGQGLSGSGYEAFRWQGGTMTGLGDLAGGGFESSAFGISADGGTVIGFGTSASGLEAFRWNGGTMTGLGDLPGGSFLSRAEAVSADGSAVVGFGTSASGTAAFVWRQATGMQSLVGLLLAAGLDPVSDGWSQLSEASGISADGRYVVGTGIRNGDTEAFLADLGPESVPEPSTWAAAGFLALGLGLRLWRRGVVPREEAKRSAPDFKERP